MRKDPKTPIADRFNKPKTIMTEAEWLAKGTALFGEDKLTWKFKCPSCGYVVCGNDYKALKEQGATGAHVGFSCIGRFMPNSSDFLHRKPEDPGPCNYAGGGLFTINPIVVTYGEGKHVEMFEFATEVANG